MPNKKLSSFTDEITTLNSTDRFLVARAGSSLDHFVTAENLVPEYKGTSTTSRAIASSGSITVSTQSGLAYVVGSRVRLASSASPANYMEGVVTSYSSTTLVFTSDVAGGSGTFASWNLSLAGDRGSTGATGAGYGGTSTTSLTIASSGSISVTTQAGLAYVVGSRIRLASSATPANYMEGVVTSYSSTTLVFTSDVAGGSGTFASWNLSLAGDRGATGSTGPTGAVSSASSLIMAHIATPSAPSAGNTAIYAKSDGNVYRRAAGGAEQVIGSGAGSGNIPAGSSAPTGSPPTVDPPSDSQAQLFLQLQADIYGITTLKLWIGIDKTGALGTNGWVDGATYF